MAVNQALRNSLIEYLLAPDKKAKNCCLKRMMYRLITVRRDVLKVSASLLLAGLLVVTTKSST